MAEIFAAAMRERGIARLIGQKTSGNVAASVVFPLDDGSGLQMAIRQIYSGNGVLLDRVGVQPDDAIVPTRSSRSPGGTSSSRRRWCTSGPRAIGPPRPPSMRRPNPR